MLFINNVVMTFDTEKVSDCLLVYFFRLLNLEDSVLIL